MSVSTENSASVRTVGMCTMKSFCGKIPDTGFRSFLFEGSVYAEEVSFAALDSIFVVCD